MNNLLNSQTINALFGVIPEGPLSFFAEKTSELRCCVASSDIFSVQHTEDRFVLWSQLEEMLMITGAVERYGAFHHSQELERIAIFVHPRICFLSLLEFEEFSSELRKIVHSAPYYRSAEGEVRDSLDEFLDVALLISKGILGLLGRKTPPS